MLRVWEISPVYTKVIVEKISTDFSSVPSTFIPKLVPSVIVQEEYALSLM